MFGSFIISVDFMDSIIIALGGNALLAPSSNQSFSKENSNMKKVAKSIAELYKRKNCSIVITHGNGTQIGDEIMRNEHAKKNVPKLPVYVINAETQASIGTLIEIALRNSLMSTNRNVCVILTHVVIDKNDPAFKKPSKQVGPIYTASQLKEELRLGKFDYIKVGAEYRRVIASPKPKIVLEADSIKERHSNEIVIAGGGGGIPLIKKGDQLIGIEAVIDKDLTTQLLANSIGAKKMIILTNANYLYADYRKKKGRIREIHAKVLKKKLETLEAGTIKPKVEACIRFIENGGKEAYIGNVFELGAILEGKSGTKITK